MRHPTQNLNPDLNPIPTLIQTQTQTLSLIRIPHPVPTASERHTNNAIGHCPMSESSDQIG